MNAKTKADFIFFWRKIIQALMTQDKPESRNLLALVSDPMEENGLTNLMLVARGKEDDRIPALALDDRGENGDRPKLFSNSLRSLSLLVQFGAVCGKCGTIHKRLAILDENGNIQSILQPVSGSDAAIVTHHELLDPLQNAPTTPTKQ